MKVAYTCYEIQNKKRARKIVRHWQRGTDLATIAVHAAREFHYLDKVRYNLSDKDLDQSTVTVELEGKIFVFACSLELVYRLTTKR